MPIKSKAQHERLKNLVKEGKLTQDELNKWEKETPNIRGLPERVYPNKVRTVKKVKTI